MCLVPTKTQTDKLSEAKSLLPKYLQPLRLCPVPRWRCVIISCDGELSHHATRALLPPSRACSLDSSLPQGQLGETCLKITHPEGACCQLFPLAHKRSLGRNRSHSLGFFAFFLSKPALSTAPYRAIFSIMFRLWCRFWYCIEPCARDRSP